MLETVREYGLDTLRADGDVENYRRIQAGIDRATTRLPPMRCFEARARVAGLAWFDANDENRQRRPRARAASRLTSTNRVRLVRASLSESMMRERVRGPAAWDRRLQHGRLPARFRACRRRAGIRLVFETFLRARGQTPPRQMASDPRGCRRRPHGFSRACTAIAEAADGIRPNSRRPSLRSSPPWSTASRSDAPERSGRRALPCR